MAFAPAADFGSILARAPRLEGNLFSQIPAFNTQVAYNLGSGVLDANAALEGQRLQNASLERIARMNNRGNRIAQAASILGSGLGSGQGIRLAGQMPGVAPLLPQGLQTPTQALAEINAFQNQLNINRALQHPWMHGSDEGTRSLVQGLA